MTTARRLLSLIPFLFCATAAAQEYGQWTWNAKVDAGHRSYRNSVNGQPTMDLRQRDLRLFVGINGFILHPAIGSFSAAVETGTTRYPSNSSTDSSLQGYRLDLGVLPDSFFPIRLYASRQDYRYQFSEADGSFFSIPDQGSSYGGRVRLRGGPLSGLEASIDRSSTEFIGAAPGHETLNREMLDWNGGSKKVQQHYRLERQSRTFARGDVRLTDILGTIEEQGTAGRWRWATYGNALRRQISTTSITSPAFNLVSVSSTMTTAEPDRPAWSFSAGSSYGGVASSASTSHRVLARYARPPKHGLQWAPSISYTVQSSNEQRVQAPGADVSATWGRNAAKFGMTVTSGVGLMRLTSSERSALSSQTRLSYSGGVAISHSATDRLSEHLEVSAAHDQLRTSSTVEGQPGFGQVGGLGTEDLRRGRFTVTGRIAGLSASAYSDWTDRRSSLSVAENRFQITSLMHSVQVSSRRVTLAAATGKSDVTANRSQNIRFRSASASLSPLSFISLSGTYRQDHREALFEPFVDGERLDAGATIQIGAFSLNPQAFWVTDRLENGYEMESRGFTLSLSRQFGGFLPIVSAPPRRGTVQ